MTLSRDPNSLLGSNNTSPYNQTHDKVLRLMNEVRNNGFIAKGIRSRLGTDERPGFKNSSS